MGVIKKIFFNFLVFFTLNLQAQLIPDTVYFSNNKFVEHIVKAGESLRSIASLHKLETSDIIEANELNKRLYYNQLLYIPIYLNIENSESFSLNEFASNNNKVDSSILNIALLMPYYLVRNDTMFSTDTLDSSKRYFNKSEAALSFHVGVLLALDSLRRSGKKIMLHSFDTNNDSISLKKIIYSQKLSKMDIIIGPMYSSLFHIICRKYGHDVSKVLISPLSRDNRNIRNFPNVYQIALTHKIQTNILIDYLIKNKLEERIIILNDKNENSLAAYSKYKFKEQNKIIESFQVNYTRVDSIRKYFKESQNVLLLSRNKAFISTMLGSIGSIDSLSTVFSFESINSYDNLDISNLMELNVHIPYSRGIDYSSKHDLRFLSLFENEYGTNPRKYSKQGYDIIMHFCVNKSLYDFSKSNVGYFEKSAAKIYHYIDYELVPVD